MTTESDEPRDVAFLVDHGIPYSEMTDEEIESVIQYRATIIVEREEAQERIRVMEEAAKADLELRKQELETAEEVYKKVMGL